MGFVLFFLSPSLGSKSGKQTTLQFKPVKKEKMKNVWSSDDESGNEDSDTSPSADVVPRERLGRKANSKSSFTHTRARTRTLSPP